MPRPNVVAIKVSIKVYLKVTSRKGAIPLDYSKQEIIKLAEDSR